MIVDENIKAVQKAYDASFVLEATQGFLYSRNTDFLGKICLILSKNLILKKENDKIINGL